MGRNAFYYLVKVSLVLLLLSLSLALGSSQSEHLNNKFTPEESYEYMKLDYLLSTLPESTLYPIRGYVGEFSFNDSVVEPPISFSNEDADPRPGVWETSEYMIGKVGVYIIFVESTGEFDSNVFDWDRNSIEWAKNAIYTALNWWRSQYPFTYPKLEFYVSRETIIGYTGYEPMLRPKEDDKLWVLDVLKRLGCGEGYNYYEIGKKCAHAIRQNWKMDWAFIIFVVNSGTLNPEWSGARAFAYLNGPYVVLPFGWFYHMMFEGTDGLARVVAHEVGHIFGATDEYNGKPERGGYLYELDNDGSKCIMDSNNWCISNGTMIQIGWVDDNNNRYPDLLENKPVVSILKDIDAVTDSDNIVVEGLFKLEPYPCKRPNCRPVTINKIIPLNSSGSLIALDGVFDSAYEPFRIIYEPKTVGYHTISVSIIDAIVGNVESYAKDILYTYLEVEAMEAALTKQRVDVNAEVPIKFKVVTAHDKKPLKSGRIFVGDYEAMPLGGGWFQVIVSSNNAGRYLYQPTGAEIIFNIDIGSGKLTKIKSIAPPIEIIYDRVVVSLEATRERVDVGTEALIKITAWYEYDGAPFQGHINLNRPLSYDEVGLITYYVTKIEDERYGLSVFESNQVQVIFDMVVVTLSSSKQRVDVGTEAQIVADAKYAYDSSPFVGKVYLSIDKEQDTVGLYNYTVAYIEDELYGLTIFQSNSLPIIFDKVVIKLTSLYDRIEVGGKAELSYEAYYRYDGSLFEGKIILNNELVSYSIEHVTYTVSQIIDYKYGLRSFESNSVKVTFDKVKTSLRTNIVTPFTVEVILEAYYASDGSPITSGILCVLDSCVSQKSPGTYSISYLEIAPITSFAGKFIVEGFNEVKLEAFVPHVGNSMTYLLLFALIMSIVMVRQRVYKKKRQQIEVTSEFICPRCGSVNYIGVKLSHSFWEYECQLCREKWYVKK